jgi:hypothetical protein
MKSLFAAALLSLGLSPLITHAQRAPGPTPLLRHQLAVPAGSTRSTVHARAEPSEAELLSHRHYRARDGHEVHSPAKSTHDQVPPGASAQCSDGTYSFSQHRRGACSHHGGVGNWL